MDCLPSWFAHRGLAGRLLIAVGLLSGCNRGETPPPSNPTDEAEAVVQSPEEAAEPLTVVGDATAPVVPVDPAAPYPEPGRQVTDTQWIAKPFQGQHPRPPIYAVTAAEFEASWKMDLSVKDQPLAEVINSITATVPGWKPKLELAEEPKPLSPEVLQQPITLQLQGVSRLEAIERACQLAGVYPEYTFDRVLAAETHALIRLHRAPRRLSGTQLKAGATEEETSAEAATAPVELVKFVGPMMIELSRLEEYPPHAVGRLEVKLRCLPLPSPVQELIQAGPAELTRVRSGDADLLVEPTIPTKFLQPTVVEAFMAQLQLKQLLRSRTRLDEVQGRLLLPLPTAAKTVWFDLLEPGRTLEEGDWQVTLKTVTFSPGSWYLRYAVEGSDSIEGLAAFAFDQAGELIPSDSYGTSWAAGFNQGSGSLNLSREPALLAVVVLTKQLLLDLPFAFTDIPLQASAAQPESIPALEYGSFEQPVSVTAGELRQENLFKQFPLTMVNHSNKDVLALELVLHYRDAQGTDLGEHVARVESPAPPAEEPYAVLVKAGSTARQTQIAFFSDEKTEQIRLTVTKVLFADSDQWEAAAPRPGQ